jgi:hypothetical protein
VSSSVLAQFLEDREANFAVTWQEGNLSEGVPYVFAEGGRDGFLAVEGELGKGGVILAI